MERIKSRPTTYSCRKFKYALANDTITKNEVTIALTVEKKIARFSNAARRLSRGISDFKYPLTSSSSPIAFNACDLSMIRFSRAISRENISRKCAQEECRRRYIVDDLREVRDGRAFW
jgi:hypothetical protein